MEWGDVKGLLNQWNSFQRVTHPCLPPELVGPLSHAGSGAQALPSGGGVESVVVPLEAP